MNPDPNGIVPAGTSASQYCLRGSRTVYDCYARAPMKRTQLLMTSILITSRENGWVKVGIFLNHCFLIIK